VTSTFELDLDYRRWDICPHPTEHLPPNKCPVTLTLALNSDSLARARVYVGGFPGGKMLGHGQHIPSCRISIGRRSFSSKLVVRTHRNTHTGPIAIPGPLVVGNITAESMSLALWLRPER